MRRPVNQPFTITTEFGVKDSYAKFGFHSGVDYGVALNHPVHAPISGQLSNVVSPTGGNMVVIYDGQFWHRLMHNNSFARSNGSVQEGDTVAYAGSTGLSFGVHVHWDINKEGVYPSSFAAFIPPADWLDGKYAPPPAPGLQPNQRILSNPTGVNQREQPSTASRIIKEWPYDQEPFNFKGFIKGEYIDGNNTWFVGSISGGYFFSGAFKGGANTDGLTDLTPQVQIPAPPPKPPLPPPAPETFAKELACITEVIPAHPSNYQTDNFPVKPTGVVLHDFGTDGLHTYQGSLAHFGKPDTTAPHITISGKNIVQNGKLSWRMYHAGPLGNDKIGIEIDPDVDTNIDTKNSVLTCLRELDEKFGPLTRFLHSQFVATACGDDITKSNLLIPASAPISSRDQEQDRRLSAIEAFIELIKKFFKNLGG